MSGRPDRSPTGDEHGRLDELAVGWALHALEPEDETLFAAHLRGCSRCAQTVADTSEVMAAMATDLSPAEPSPRLRDRLHAAVAATEQIPPGQVPESESTDEPAAGAPRTTGPAGMSSGASAVPAATGFPGYRAVPPAGGGRPSLRRRAPLLALAAALAAVVGLGVWNGVLVGSRADLQAALAEREQVVDSLLVPGEATVTTLSTDEGRAVATVVARDERLDVVTHGLAANDTDAETYVVWGIDGEQPEPIGIFDVTGSQIAVQTVGSGATGLDDYSGFGISLEPGQEAPSSPTEIVAMG